MLGLAICLAGSQALMPLTPGFLPPGMPWLEVIYVMYTDSSPRGNGERLLLPGVDRSAVCLAGPRVGCIAA